MSAAMQPPQVTVTSTRRASSLTLLLVGAGLVFMTFMRYSLAELGWVVFTPFLVCLHERATIGRHIAVLATLLIGFLVTVSKMVTPEIPWAPVPGFAVPMALSYFLAIAFASLAHRKLGARWGIYVFACMAVALGWIQYTFTPGSSWGVLAHTQLENLPLVQLAALTGVGGITFLVAMGSGVAAAAWSSGLKVVRTDIAVFGILLGSALGYGQLRLGHPAPGVPMRVGGVISPVTHREFRAAYKNVDTLRLLDDELSARSARAVDFGARVVVWPEIATLVTRTSEPAVAARGQAFANARGILLLMAYGVFDTAQPTRASLYTNKDRLYGPDGSMLDEYVKRHPVPVDPNPAGTAHARVISLDGVRISGGICYDYGFPEIARDNANDGAGLALVPSSDWRGIDPEHGRMALMNAVAVGLPMVRPVRAATSIASDQYGRLLSSLRADAGGDGVMVVAMPTERVPTVYARTGELLPLVALAFCILALVRVLRLPAQPDSRSAPSPAGSA
jgi:apolipoprotein N-acyltransferase